MIMKSQNKRRVVLSFISFLFVLIYVGCSSSPKPTNKTETSELTTQEKNWIKNTLSNHYGGYEDMLKKGFSPEMLDTVDTISDLYKLFDTYIQDTHFTFSKKGYEQYHQKRKAWIPDFDKDTSNIPNSNKFYYPAKNNLGQDYVYAEYLIDSPKEEKALADRTYYEKPIGNNETYYIRVGTCDNNSNYKNMSSAHKNAAKYTNIILDGRSNSGGGQGPLMDFFNGLKSAGYDGTIYVLQDYHSYSSGELYCIADRYKSNLNIILIGTNSGGMQKYANCIGYEKGDLWLWLPSNYFALPERFMGEGLGYPADIWSLTKDLKKTFDFLNVNTTGIYFAPSQKPASEFNYDSSYKIVNSGNSKMTFSLSIVKDSSKQSNEWEYANILDSFELASGQSKNVKLKSEYYTVLYDNPSVYFSYTSQSYGQGGGWMCSCQWLINKTRTLEFPFTEHDYNLDYSEFINK